MCEPPKVKNYEAKIKCILIKKQGIFFMYWKRCDYEYAGGFIEKREKTGEYFEMLVKTALVRVLYGFSTALIRLYRQGGRCLI